MGLRKGRKVGDIPKRELAEIQKKEREYRRERKKQDAKKNAVRVKEKLTADMGRPITSQEMLMVASEERRKAFLSFFNHYGGNVAAACTATGITRSTFNRWFSKYPEFNECITEVNDAILDFAESQLVENIKNGKEHSLFFFLCNKGKHRGWQDIRRLAAPKLRGINININYVDNSNPNSKSIDSVVVEDADANRNEDAGEPGCTGEQETVRLPAAERET